MYVNNVKEGSFMFVFIRNISIKGIKSINNKIELIFSKKEIKDYSELRDYNIKAIYGPNGSGKTAIVHAFQLIRQSSQKTDIFMIATIPNTYMN
jgi:AAA15 family ATPase/GTPase